MTIVMINGMVILDASESNVHVRFNVCSAVIHRPYGLKLAHHSLPARKSLSLKNHCSYSYYRIISVLDTIVNSTF